MSPSKPTVVSRHKKPSGLSEEEWQREIRKQSVPEDQAAAFTIRRLGGEHPVFADYLVENPLSAGSYKVALRSKQPGPNFCSCLDFKTNLLGTCKHIEAVLLSIKKSKRLAKLLNDDYRPAYSSVYLEYGETRQVKLRIGEDHQAEYRQLAKDYFSDSLVLLPEAYGHIDQFLAEAGRISPDFHCYPDVLDYIIASRETKARHDLIERKVNDKYLDSLLKTTLYPYQKEGVLFAARAGRCLIADDMGLGKTIQAIGSAEFFKKDCNINSVLIICPTSLKYQWKNEIEKFTSSRVAVIEGSYVNRRPQYADPASFYKIISYGVVGADLAEIRKLSPDLVILDEAQRIKNWQTKTAQQVKKIASTYAIVLTGTPIENKLEELYSITQFIDPFKLGPLYKFLAAHQTLDDYGKIIGYRELNQIHKVLSDVVIRRTKKSVMTQLPARSDKQLFVPLTEQQANIHTEYAEMVMRLVSKWKRFKFLDEKDRQRLMIALNCMRMVADSTFILDQETRFDTKIDELMFILDNLLAAGEEKAVVFSQWERMTRLVRAELESRQIDFAYLHGGVPSQKRMGLLDDFRDNPDCRVFLSTDAGGVGLNLQSASFVVNLDIPWNPAVLEQRIGRVHRHGQKRNISVVNLVSRASIEERMLEVLAFKSSLFAGVLDNGSNEIFMGESKFKRFMSSVEEITGHPSAEPLAAAPAVEEQERDEAVAEPKAAGPASAVAAADFFQAAGRFFDNLGRSLSDGSKASPATSLIEKDPESGQAYLKLPIDNQQFTAALEAVTTLLGAIKG